MSTPLIEARNVTRVLPGIVPVTLVQAVNLVIRPREFVAITGPSGSGKSSLLYLLGLLDLPTEGDVLINGRSTTRMSEEERAKARLTHLGFVFQFHFLLPEFSLTENVALPMRALGALSDGEIRARAEGLLDSLGLADHRNKRPDQISGGQRQRVAVARALANEPPVVLADEPTGNLDSKSTEQVFALLRSLVDERGKTVVAVTHDLSLAARMDRRVDIVDGRIVSDEKASRRRPERFRAAGPPAMVSAVSPVRIPMHGFGSLFIAVCMALIGASAGAIAHFWAGYTPVEAGLIALALLFALMTYQVFAARKRDRAEMAGRYEDLARATSNIAREVGELGRRVSALEGAPIADLRSVTAPLAKEVDALIKRVEEVANTIVAREARAVPAKNAEAPAAAPLTGYSEEEMRKLLREAVDAGRVELYLQPVVTLPQRKVRFYEALSRIRLADGSLIEPERFLEGARAFGLMPRIDLRLMRSCVQVVRRLAAMNREVGLFVNFTRETFADASFFNDVLGLLDANRALAPSLVIEIAQESYRSLGSAEHERLAALSERGFHFALGRTEDLRIDLRALAAGGFRFVKVSAEIMLQRNRSQGSAIHPAELADQLGRQGIDLVVVRIENEATVVDLLDHDVRYGQGFLFAPPRPVRAEVLSGRAPELDAVEKVLVEAAAGPER